jgi:hypothetical protein
LLVGHLGVEVRGTNCQASGEELEGSGSSIGLFLFASFACWTCSNKDVLSEWVNARYLGEITTPPPEKSRRTLTLVHFLFVLR